MNGSEWTCLWYLRLNGYLTIPNFIAHGRGGPLTEVDVLGVRFPHSTEFQDDPRLSPSDSLTDVILAEAKAKHVDTLNGPWSSPDKGALDYVLKRLGIAPASQVKEIAGSLYERRSARWEGFRIRIAVFAETIGENLKTQGVVFVEWKQVIGFIHERFNSNERLKADHETWDDFGKYLWREHNSHTPPEATTLFDGWEKRPQV